MPPEELTAFLGYLGRKGIETKVLHGPGCAIPMTVYRIGRGYVSIYTSADKKVHAQAVKSLDPKETEPFSSIIATLTDGTFIDTSKRTNGKVDNIKDPVISATYKLYREFKEASCI